MKRVLTIFAIIAAALAALTIVAWIGVFHTPPGREFLEEIVEAELGGALNSKADIGALKGAPPGLIVLENVSLEDEEGPWLTAQRLELRWRPLALIRKRIIIDEAAIDGVRFLRNPPPGEETEDDSAQINLSINAPKISIDALEINDFQAAVGGKMERIDGEGALRLDGPDIYARLALTSSGGFDQADITFEKAPRENRFFLSATVLAEIEGVIATILDLHGPLRIDATGGGDVEDANVELTGVIGHYGEIDLSLASNLENFTGADLNLGFTAGERLAHITELAAPATLDARIGFDKRGGTLAVKSLTSAIGVADGSLEWRAPRGDVERLTAALNANFAEEYRKEIQTYLGDTAAITAELNWRRADYALAATVDGLVADIAIENGRTDLDRRLAGDLSLSLSENAALPAILAVGAQGSGAIDIDLDRHFRASRLSIETADGATFRGSGAYETAEKQINLTGDFSLTANAVRALSPSVRANGAVAGDIDVSGSLDRFTAIANFETPELRMNDGALPPMAVKAELAGLPKLPTGDILATARNGAPRRFEAQLRSSETGLIRAPKLLYAGRGFRLEGTGDFDPGPQTANLDLTYNGDNEAEPWPGIGVNGDAAIKGVLSRDGALNNLNASAGSLSVNDIAAAGFAMTAQGPPGSVNVTLSGDRFSAPGIEDILEYSAEGVVALRGAPTVTLSQFEALIADNRARLTETARINLENGVAIDNLRLAYGAGGSIALDGAMSSARWQADAALSNVNIPNADGQISLTLDLDTDAQTPARADFSLRSLLLNREEASISGNAVWDGSAITLADDDADEKIDMRIVLPARLVRTPKIAIETEGALDGYIRYDGDIQALAAYLPPTLQTLEGKLDASFNLGGDTSAPDLSGSANLTEGAYTELGSGFSLAGMHAQAEAKYEDGRSVVAFTGGARGADQSRADTIAFTGDLTLGDASRVALDVKLDNAVLSAHPINNVRANGTLNVTGPFDALEANGDIVIDEMDAEIVAPESTGLVDIVVVAYNDERAAPETLTPERNSALKYTIKLSADDRIFIRGRGLESEWAANATVVNGREQPVVVGDLSLRRGWLDFSGRRFDLTRGAIRFDLLAVNNPVLDIRAEHDTGDGVTAAIVISGRAQEPQVSLESTPSMPQEDVMALILFGKPAQDLSPFESIQIAEALASLSGVGPFGGEGVTGRLRNAVGLDLLNVDIDPENGGGSLTVGKYVADGFFVSATQDAEGKNGSVRVKYEITDNITVETELEQTGDQTVSANWKKDF